MERFAIKINETLRKNMYNICRLCGIDNPNKIPLFEEVIIECEMDGLDIEPDFCNKILLCVGIEVSKDDNMPSMVCSLCSDKINDFYEFREMCKTTNTQTRLLLGLPPEEKENFQDEILRRKKRKFTVDESTEEIKTFSQTKKVKNEIIPETTTSLRTRNSTQILRKQTESLLEIKIPNAREREDLRRRGRKIKNNLLNDLPLSTKKVIKVQAPPPEKLVEKLFKVSCKICKKKFPSVEDHKIHLETIHIPKVYDFGCIACKMSFMTAKEHKDHHCWHKTSGTPYICFHCSKSHDNRTALTKHFSVHRREMSEEFFIKPNIKCDKCNKEFLTENLYDWHKCFIKTNGTCRKCNRQICKKSHLFKHFIKCKGNGIELEKTLAKQNAEINSRLECQASYDQELIKTEPECELTEIDSDCYVVSAEHDNQPICTIMPINNIKAEPPDIYQNMSDSETNILEPNILIKTEPNHLINYLSSHNAATTSNTLIGTIKKEKLDNLENSTRSNIIANIKQEPGKEVTISNTIGAGTLKLKIKKEHGTLNASFVNKSVINPLAKRNKKSKKNKIYKKPFELTIKIKQEIMERDSQIGDVNSNDGQNMRDFDDNIPRETSAVNNITLPIISEVFRDDFGASAKLGNNTNDVQVPIIASVESGVTMPPLNITNDAIMPKIVNSFSLDAVKMEHDSSLTSENIISNDKEENSSKIPNPTDVIGKELEKEDDVTIIEHNHDVIVLDDDEEDVGEEKENKEQEVINKNDEKELDNVENKQFDENNFTNFVLTSVRSLSDNIEVNLAIKEPITLDQENVINPSFNDVSDKEVAETNNVSPSTSSEKEIQIEDTSGILKTNCDSKNDETNSNVEMSPKSVSKSPIQETEEKNEDELKTASLSLSPKSVSKSPIQETEEKNEDELKTVSLSLSPKSVTKSPIQGLHDEDDLLDDITDNAEINSNKDENKVVDPQDEDTLLEDENNLLEDILLEDECAENEDILLEDNSKTNVKGDTPLVDELKQIKMDSTPDISQSKELNSETSLENLNREVTPVNLEGASNMLDDISDDDDDQMPIDSELEKRLLDDLSDDDNIVNENKNSDNTDNSMLLVENTEN